MNFPFKRLSFRLVLIAVLLGLSSLCFSQSETAVPQRSEIEDQYKWRVGDMYTNNNAWEADFKKVEGMLTRFESYKGKIGQSPKSLLDLLTLQDSLGMIVDQLYVYSNLRRDEDNRASEYQEMSTRAASLQTKAGQATSFIEPELTTIPQATIQDYIKKEAGLKKYSQYFDNLWRTQAHILPPEQEELLALAGDMARGSSNVFEMLDNADVKYGKIKGEDGKEVELSKARFRLFLESNDRRVRKDANQAFHEGYHAFYNTMGANISANVSKDIFYSKARKYGSSLEAALDENNVPVSVYKNLIKTVTDNLAPSHRYSALRKKVLKLDELHPYDLYVPLVPQAKIDFSYQEAKNILTSGLNVLGKTYISDMSKGFTAGWIDVYETQGKGGGAYSWGTYTSHPYVLMNYNGSLDDVFTLAHEMGHAMNSFYTNRTQPYIDHGYPIFVAEVASITNEVLLMKELLKTTTDPEKKLYLLNYFLDQINGTFYRQTMFAEFELEIHERAERGEALSSESLSKLFRELYQKYLGPELVIDSVNDFTWARIPHFYYNYYVFQYATGQAAGVALSENLSKGDPEAQRKYLEFLAAGSSDYAINLLKKAGVDMTSPEPILAVIRLFDEMVGEMEKMVK
ncbi:MAG: oligoendopeptidase F [candidate division Zixibacteria bacterium]|nr:oligoendopeptidase F [candidate division Zixibacteria bacterium]